jgi:hypothetical protein
MVLQAGAAAAATTAGGLPPHCRPTNARLAAAAAMCGACFRTGKLQCSGNKMCVHRLPSSDSMDRVIAWITACLVRMPVPGWLHFTLAIQESHQLVQVPHAVQT